MTEYRPTSAVCVLYAVYKNEPITAREVAERLDAEQGHMSDVLRRLAHTGVVTREKRLEQKGQPYEYTVKE